MNFILNDTSQRVHLLPLTFTRPIGELRIGILTIKEKWEKCLNHSISFKTEDYLSIKFPAKIEASNCLIYGGLLPDEALKDAILSLKSGQALLDEKEQMLAIVLSSSELENYDGEIPANFEKIIFKHDVLMVTRPWHLFQLNDKAIKSDFELITKGRVSQPLSNTNTLLGENIFIEEGAWVECAILNSTTGPIYIGKNAEIMEGAMIRGGLALCEGAGIKMGAKIYGASTFGPHCKIGGEVGNSVFQAFSNKGHEGYVGNSVVGEWCNFGADTNTSNLKNNYANVKIWSYAENRFADTGSQFCGLIMGDHTKVGINTMFNTGTVVGVSCNIFGDGFPRNFIPSFSWGGAAGFTPYKYEAAAEVATRMMGRRQLAFDEIESNILKHLYDQTTKA
jgi:UDP-N-acetylglucosamine diphosphorylase/glucosamine-1-phosphate N-acetyltransferase